ncbi:hypothetical protein NRK67_12990 [Fusobacteria bacterium ZRK30]|nr:hypothetical protein NRK67_12990 [Fusobacteria bacterium ZRK30]
MKKTFIIGFILLSIAAKGDLGTDIKQNQIILDNIKLENAQLKEEVKRLSQILDKLEINLAKEIKFEDLGVEIRRDIESFTLKIASEDLSQGEYNSILDNFIEITKYDPKDPIIFQGSKGNTEFLNSYFTAKGFDLSRITVEIKEDNELIPEKKGIKVVDTRIILKKKEN